MYGSNCKEAEEEGVSILHGNRGVYHDDKQPAFKVIYDAIRDVSETRHSCLDFQEQWVPVNRRNGTDNGKHLVKYCIDKEHKNMLFLVDNRMLSLIASTLTMGAARYEKVYRIPYYKKKIILCILLLKTFIKSIKPLNSLHRTWKSWPNAFHHSIPNTRVSLE